MSQDLLKDLVAIGSITSVIVTLITVLVTRTIPWAQAKLHSRAAKKLLGETFSDVDEAIRYYIEPRCDSKDPSEGIVDIGADPSNKRKLFRVLDESLASPRSRYLFILADSGMGKTSALINYFARHVRKWRKPFRIAIVPLGISDADARIEKIQQKEDTVLFLDALDEDQEAIKNYHQRIDQIIGETLDFRAILITCRTQFFPSDAAIPISTKRKKTGPRPAGRSAEHTFEKIFLSPFSQKEVLRFIRKRYPIWKLAERLRTLSLVKSVPSLVHRPMLLAHLDVLAKSRTIIGCSLDLFEEMVEAWLRRERGFVPDTNHLRTFSELAAVDMLINSGRRGMERMPRPEIEQLAKEWAIPLEAWILTNRSLLNRDDEGNYKFAHRTIMEYLCLCRLAKGDQRILVGPATEDAPTLGVQWTDQMLDFFGEIAEFARPWLIGVIPAIVGHPNSRSLLGNICFRMGDFCKTKEQWLFRIGNLSCAISLCAELPFAEVVVLSVDIDDSMRLHVSVAFRARYEKAGESYILEELKSRQSAEISVNTLFGLFCLPESAQGRKVSPEAVSLLPNFRGVFTVAPKGGFREVGKDQGRLPSAIIGFGSELPDEAMLLHAQLVRIWRNAEFAENDFSLLNERTWQ
ncbi:MAG TPA: hypothetical protein VN493_30270 [Thermoanaerobaculia bacterium]|nr:hypothetical protein [Thermoanaerobaculia bacterium]